ncbi:MAG: hypothetical protein Kow00108_16560 [Calditrichia bacterium]
MKFINPWILWIAILAAIPLILHILNKKNVKTIYFSSVSLLKSVEKSDIKRLKLKELLLLLLRILAVLLLVLAFANPVIRLSGDGLLSGNNDRLIVILDNSISNKYTLPPEKDTKDNLKILCNKLLESSRNSTTTFWYQQNLQWKSMEINLSKNNVDSVSSLFTYNEPYLASKSLEKRLKERFLSDPNTSFIFLSDFQSKEQYNFINLLPDEKTILVQAVYNNISENVVIEKLSLQETPPVMGANVTGKIFLSSGNAENEQPSVLNLYLNGKMVMKKKVSLSPGQNKIINFEIPCHQAGWNQLIARLEDDEIQEDNEWYSTFQVIPEINILFSSESGFPEMETLLSTGSRHYRMDITTLLPGQLNTSSLSKFKIILLHASLQQITKLESLLDIYVRNGGTLVIFPQFSTEDNQLAPLNLFEIVKIQKIHELNKGIGLDLNNLPSFLSDYKKLSNSFEPESKLLAEIIPGQRTETILKFSNGWPFLVHQSTQQGDIYLFSSNFGIIPSPITLSPLFPALMLHLIQTSGNPYPNVRHYYHNNENSNLVELIRSINKSTIKLKDPMDRISFLSFSIKNSTEDILSYFVINGMYTLEAGEENIQIAVNTDRQELKLEQLTKEEIKNQWKMKWFSINHLHEKILVGARDMFLWKYLLLISLILIILELIIGDLSISSIRKEINS